MELGDDGGWKIGEKTYNFSFIREFSYIKIYIYRTIKEL